MRPGADKADPTRSLSVAEVAKAWGVSGRTVYRWLEEGDLREGIHYSRTPRGQYRLNANTLPQAEDIEE